MWYWGEDTTLNNITHSNDGKTRFMLVKLMLMRICALVLALSPWTCSLYHYRLCMLDCIRFRYASTLKTTVTFDITRTGPRSRTFVLLQQLCGVFNHLVVLLQLQHTLTVVEHQGDDEPGQAYVVFIPRLLLHGQMQSSQLSFLYYRCSRSPA